jgi:hypothetical protein
MMDEPTERRDDDMLCVKIREKHKYTVTFIVNSSSRTKIQLQSLKHISFGPVAAAVEW